MPSGVLSVGSPQVGSPQVGSPAIAIAASIEARLRALAPAESRAGSLDAAIRYALLAPGKRLRPLLTLLAAWELGARDLKALDAACALEMVHAASLVLDDLPCMDDAPERRGRPSTHVAYGQDVAILCAVALLGRAFLTVASMEEIDPARRAQITVILSEAVGANGLAAGQLEDLRGNVRTRPLDRIADANHLKTGVLFVAAVEMACAIVGAGAAERERLVGFATHFGQAFQLADDVADGVRPDGHGEDAGKTTMASMLGLDDSRRRLALHRAQALDAVRPGGPLAALVFGLFAEAEGLGASGSGRDSPGQDSQGQVSEGQVSEGQDGSGQDGLAQDGLGKDLSGQDRVEPARAEA